MASVPDNGSRNKRACPKPIVKGSSDDSYQRDESDHILTEPPSARLICLSDKDGSSRRTPSTTPLEMELAEAEDRASQYEWTKAAQRYTQILESHDSTIPDSEKGRVLELAARCWYKSAFQSEERDEFKKRMSEAAAIFRKTARHQESLGSKGSEKMCDAMSLFADFWLSDDISQRRASIEKSVASALESYHILNNEDNHAIFQAYPDLAAIVEQAQSLATDYQSRRTLYESVAKIPSRAIENLEMRGDAWQLVEALSSTIRILLALSYSVLEPAKYFEQSKNIRILRTKLDQMAKKVGSPDAMRLASEGAGMVTSLLDEDFPKAQAYFEEALRKAEPTRDSGLIGNLSSEMVYASSWAGWREEDVEKRRELLEKGLRAAPEAIKCFQLSYQTSVIHNVYAFYAECYGHLAVFVETDPRKKTERLVKALEVARMGLPYQDWGWLGNLISHSISKSTFFLATQALDKDEKVRLLKEALQLRERNVEGWRRIAPYSRELGVALNYLALVKAELAKLEPDPQTRLGFLRPADSHMEECVSQMRDWCVEPASMRLVAYYSETHGDILNALYQITQDRNDARKAIGAYYDARSWLTRAGLIAPLPTLTWKIAKVQDLLRDFRDAADSFRKASESFALASKKVLNGPSIFGDMVYYMDAWAFIEEARLHHLEEDFSAAALSYERASNVLHATKTWNHLSSLYAASSDLEEAEALSRLEKPKDSVETFRRAEETFAQAKSRLERRLELSRELGEKDELAYWLDVAGRREKYCRARMSLEEAMLLDRQDQKLESLRKYQTASELFRALLPIVGTRGKRELETLALLSDAWAKMREAENGFSPKSYLDAAKLFHEAEKTALSSRLKPVALANAEICKAFASATELSRGSRSRSYTKVKGSLESAYEYYQKSGFLRAAEWTRATQRFFDALAYLWEAEVEIDPSRKGEFYHLAEKLLELAGRLYAQAGFPGKEAETRRHLRRARGQKELLLSPSEVFSHNPIMSQVSVPPASFLRDKPLGLERFEGANIKGRMIAPQEAIREGSEFTVELEMTNIGKSNATLVRIENLTAEGLQIKNDGAMGLVDSGILDLKGHRIGPLKTHKVQISVKALNRGIFDLSPRLILFDDKAQEVVSPFDPSSLVVQEKNGTARRQPRALREILSGDLQVPITWFENQRSKTAFQCLAKDFARDYMTKGMYEENSGWRSLMELIRETDLPRSSLYGPDGRDGAILAELDRRGLIERRVFQGERGRGGAIERVRVAYDNPVVKMIVKQAILEAF